MNKIYIVLIIIFILNIFGIITYIKQKVEEYESAEEWIKYVESMKRKSLGYKVRPYKIYYINMDKSVDRRKNMEKQFRKWNIPAVRIRGIDGYALKDKNKGTLYNGMKFENYSTRLNPGEIGCTLSHIIAIKEAYNNMHSQVIFLEDDTGIDLLNNVEHRLSDVLRPHEDKTINLSPAFTPLDLDKKFTTDFGMSTVAFYMPETEMKKIIDTYIKGNTIILPQSVNISDEMYNKYNVKDARADILMYGGNAVSYIGEPYFYPRLGDSTMGYGGATGLEKKRIEDIIEKTKDIDKYHDTSETKK